MKQMMVKPSLTLPRKTISTFHIYAIGVYYRHLGNVECVVVEVDGNLGPVTACNAPVWDGMNVVTESDNITELRRKQP